MLNGVLEINANGGLDWPDKLQLKVNLSIFKLSFYRKTANLDLKKIFFNRKKKKPKLIKYPWLMLDYDEVKKILKNVVVPSLRLESVIGTGDAAVTALVCGAYTSLLTSVIGGASFHISGIRKKDEFLIRTTPDFYNVDFRYDFKCIIRFGIRKIIFTVLLIYFKKIFARRKRNEQSSD